ncbi:MAG: hypothetical protein HYU87_08905 [Chloroflexi bacterium]|nr:hypothetical protein [Chloroflexota bacterium]
MTFPRGGLTERTEAAPRSSSGALQASVLDLSDEEGGALRARIDACPGVTYSLVDARSAYVYAEFGPPCDAETVLGVLRSTGRPVLSDPGCC